tara:strand:+ start:101 stop:616 length:516 start_codon:yes stop_codon:yes gene_type:complete
MPETTLGDPLVAVAVTRIPYAKCALSTEAQTEAIQAWADGRGVRITAWFHQEVPGVGLSKTHHACMDAIASLQLNRAGIVVVACPAAFARNARNAAILAHLANAAGARVECADGSAALDEKLPNVVLYHTIIGAVEALGRAKATLQEREALAVSRLRRAMHAERRKAMEAP